LGGPVPSVCGVPRQLIVKAVTSLRSYLWRRLRGEQSRAFEYQLWLCFFAGIVRQCVRESREGFAAGVITPASADPRDDLSRPVHASTGTGAAGLGV
jgi:hypothetical protein